MAITQSNQACAVRPSEEPSDWLRLDAETWRGEWKVYPESLIWLRPQGRGRWQWEAWAEDLRAAR